MNQYPTRRNILLTTAATLAATTLSTTAADPPPANKPEDLFDRPMRWFQLVLAENDPGTYDPQFWLDYFTKIHADAVCLSAGGCVAYYPTKIPHHHRSAW